MAFRGRSIWNFIRLHAAHTWARLRKSHSTLRLTVSAIALGLGFIGYCKLSPPVRAYDYLENWYKAMGLLVISMPREYPDLPIELQIARFALPLATLWIAIGTYLDYARRPFRLFSAIRRHGHTVVCGLGKRPETIAKEAASRGCTVVMVAQSADNSAVAPLEAQGITVVAGELDRHETFARAGVDRATEIVVATGDDVTNLRAAMAVRSLVDAQRPETMAPLILVAECSQPDMAAILGGAFHSIRDGKLEYRLLSPEANIARGLLPRLLPVISGRHHAGAVLMIGATPVMQAVVDQVLRNVPPGSALAWAGEKIADRQELLSIRCPGLEAAAGIGGPGLDFIEWSRIERLAIDLAPWLDRHPDATVIVDTGSEDANMRIALTLRRLARDRNWPTGAVFLRQDGSGATIEAMTLIEGEAIDLSRLTLFGSIKDECRHDLIFRGTLDRLAKIVHEDYRASGSQGDAALPWESLSETYRQASRHQADHIGVKLAVLDLAYASADSGDIGLTDAEIERLARLEHYRWCMDRWLDGWVLGPVKDARTRTHPSLVAYDDLDETVKELDRRAVRNLPALVRATGSGLCRFERVAVAAGAFDDAARAQVEERVRAGRTDGRAILLEIGVDSAASIDVAQWAKENGAAFELVLAHPVSELRQTLPWQPLRSALDAAVNVRFDTEVALQSCADSA